ASPPTMKQSEGKPARTRARCKLAVIELRWPFAYYDPTNNALGATGSICGSTAKVALPLRLSYFSAPHRMTGNGMDRLLPHPASLRGLAAVNRRSSNEAKEGL